MLKCQVRVAVPPGRCRMMLAIQPYAIDSPWAWLSAAKAGRPIANPSAADMKLETTHGRHSRRVSVLQREDSSVRGRGGLVRIVRQAHPAFRVGGGGGKSHRSGEY